MSEQDKPQEPIEHTQAAQNGIQPVPVTAAAPTEEADDTDSSSYNVALDVFSGPMDLLLYLIKKSEVSIWEIPIADIADQYLDYVKVMDLIDIELAGEFMVMAASLMEVKSRMLLPRPQEDDEDAEDPRSELIHQLLEYKRFKEASFSLNDLEQEAGKRFHRLTDDRIEEDHDPDDDENFSDLTLWDLMSAFKRVMASIDFDHKAGIVYDNERPVHKYMDDIVERLKTRPIASFIEFFKDKSERSVIIGVFLAILELVKMKSIRAEQSENGYDIRLILITEEHPQIEDEYVD